MRREITYIFILFLSVVGCNDKIQKAENPQFELLTKDLTGIDFENRLEETTEFNALKYMYFFNGGGVAAGDFNNDGLQDLYFTSNMGKNGLFLNEGNLQFKDATEAANVGGTAGAWTSGVAVVDVNNDGMLDIYVSQVGDYKMLKGKNQFFICQKIENGIPIYEDKAAEYGLDLVGFCTQAAFFDYDLDGDLDMYQMKHSVHANGTFGQKKTFKGSEHPLSGDRLLRNDGGKFVDVSKEAGIRSTVIGYGLGIVTGDVNQDGYPDIYIGNDFHEDDYLYINQGDGTFLDMRKVAMRHSSRFSMGVEMADLNNDGMSEIMSLDMLPNDPYILKSSLGEDDFKIFRFKLGYGYLPQYARNNLQLNRGDGTFSEIGMFSDVYATDWSWGVLMTDFDNDGYKDIFISNGIPRRMNDIDYANFRKSDPDVMWTTNHLDVDDNLEFIKMMPQIKLRNKFFKNQKNLNFKDLAVNIKNDKETYSNGSVYVDLDNDGDLDIVTNNIEAEPYIYKNLANEKEEKGDFIAIQLKGSPQNINAIGARAIIFKKNEKIVVENYPVRGYQSSSQIGLHIGVGNKEDVEKVVIIWSDGTFQALENVLYNQQFKLDWMPNLPKYDFKNLQPQRKSLANFKDVTIAKNVDFQHEENPFVEFNREQLIPHMVSSERPALAVGDLNGDGREDFFIGNSKRRPAAIFYQNANGTFSKNTPVIIQNDSIHEDVDAQMMDIENDGDLDLVIASGGNEYRGTEEPRKQRIYINQGNGNFEKVYFPNAHLAASCILPSDVNGDGLTDFFIGARAKTWNYGKTPDSYLYINKGNGQFEDATDKIAKDLRTVGLVKDGSWADMDGDGDADLVLALEWDAITIFYNENGQLRKRAINEMKGWWNFAKAHDFDGDGDVDIIAGNLGMNAKFKPSDEEPLRLYVNDFDDNKQIEQILTYHLGGREIPFATHMELTKQLPHLKKDYIYAKNLAKASISDIFGQSKLKKAEVLEANTMPHYYFENDGNGNFMARLLPDELQWSTLEAIELADVNGDGTEEVILGGNFFDCNVEMGRYDANYGNILQFKDGKMSVYSLGNLNIEGQVRRISTIHINGKTCFILAKNDMAVQVIELDN